MPIDAFQMRVIRTLAPLRSPDSTFAGGAVLQRHGFRLSDDQDLFHADDADIVAIAERDAAALAAAGFDVEIGHSHEGLIEASVSIERQGATRIQWLQSGTWNFFKPVPDDIFGWRLHMADLAVNKALAAGGRRQVRDYVDLALIHEHLIPLWHACWAAPGKDDYWSPLSLIEKIAATSGFRQADVDAGVLATVEVNVASIIGIVRAAIDEAREVLPRLPPELAGKLFVDNEGGVVSDLGRIASGTVIAIEAQRGGAWPSSSEIDHQFIQRLIDVFGAEGVKEPPYNPFPRPSGRQQL